MRDMRVAYLRQLAVEVGFRQAACPNRRAEHEQAISDANGCGLIDFDEQLYSNGAACPTVHQLPLGLITTKTCSLAPSAAINPSCSRWFLEMVLGCSRMMS